MTRCTTPETCSLRVGDAVTVSPLAKYAVEWPDTYIVTGVRWEYQSGDGKRINIAIAHQTDIGERYGDTDGWRVADLVAVAETDSRDSSGCSPREVFADPDPAPPAGGR